MWRCQLKTCWCCNCCWWWSCWQHFVTDLEAEVKKLTFFSNFEHNVWSKFWSWNSDKIWSWSLLSFLCWCFVEVMLNPSRILVDILKQGLGKILKLKFYERLMFGSDFEVDAWSRFLRWNLIKICVWTCDINSTLGSVVPLAMFSSSKEISIQALYLSGALITKKFLFLLAVNFNPVFVL